jgi:uncharacterized protein
VGSASTFVDQSVAPIVRGYLHSPATPNGNGLVLTHGAGGNSNAPVLVALAEAFCGHGYIVLRCDLPYRQDKSFGPPSPGIAERDRAGLRNAVIAMRKQATERVFLGGHSYGGRQSTILCASETDLVLGLLLLSYPLHPPRKPEQLRTRHLPNLRTPSLFVHGTRDPFGSSDEIKNALNLVRAKNELMEVEGAGHDLGFKGKTRDDSLPALIYSRFDSFFR